VPESDLSRFFLVVPPGFEELAERELVSRRFYSLTDTSSVKIKKVKGGLEIECPQELSLALNRFSRLGTRVLMRLAEFRCRDFPKLFKRIQSVPWHEFIRGDGSTGGGGKGDPTFSVEVSARKSRLMNQKRIAEAVSDGVKKSLRGHAGKKAAPGMTPTEIYVRFEDDMAQISLDTSGEALFKRGYKTLEALAPLRENFAAGLFFALWDFAGRPLNYQLVDPLCGSGTFLTEGGLFWSEPPARNFDFQKWFTGEIPRLIPPFTDKNNKVLESRNEVFGFDRHPEALRLAEENLRAAGLVQFSLQQKDFLKEPVTLPSLNADAGPEWQKTVRLGIANPPYGVRIQLPAPPAEFYARLIGAFESLECQAFGFIVPREHLKHLPKSANQVKFSNGGLDVTFVIYKA
jgi:putative N6-adenine-specific DNA methylase